MIYGIGRVLIKKKLFKKLAIYYFKIRNKKSDTIKSWNIK